MGLIFRFCLWVASWLSRSNAFRVAGSLSRLLAKTDSAFATRANLEVCFPTLTDPERETLETKSLQHMAMLFFELAQLRYWSLEELLADIEIEGQDLLEAKLQENKGLILLVPHLGNWELMCVYLGHYYSVAALYDPPKVGGLEAVIKQARERFSGKMFAIGVGGMRSVLRELKSGGLVAILPDQVPDRDGGIYVPFFGRDALTMTLPAQLHEKTGARVLMGTVSRRLNENKLMGYRLTFSEIDGAMDTAPAISTSINAAIESAILLTPEQYQWEYKRFKRPPEGGRSNIYRRQ